MNEQTTSKTAASPEIQRLHERSTRLYPTLNLTPNEYVIAVVHRHPIGLFIPLATGALLIAIALSILANYDIILDRFSRGVVAFPTSIAVPVWAFVALVGLGMYIAYYVYIKSRFILTNESVIQEIQYSLFSRKEQTVSLGSIEDASFTQKGIIQQLFGYGDIRLSTVGDETTYRFSYVSNPKDHIARLNNAVENFKNGRPVREF